MSMAGSPPPTVYRPAVITFLDILGFRELIATRSAEDIAQIVRLARSSAAVAQDEEDVGYEHTTSLTFSDSVIRIRFYDTEYPAGALFHEILNLVHAQANLIASGILVRGGVTTGEIYAAGDNIFGPGFVQAYTLESEFANYPRIVIGPEVFRALRTDRRLRADHHDVEDEVHYLRSVLRQGDDGLWFVDYLRAIEREMDEPSAYPDYLRSHRQLIIEGATAAAGSARTLQKYLWLARYHNAVCKGFAADDASLQVTAEDVPALEQLSDIAHDIREE